jgi:hypothetical protein
MLHPCSHLLFSLSLTRVIYAANAFAHAPACTPARCQVAGEFYTSPLAQALWRRHVRFMLTRVNRYTGVSLAEDPTVSILELANEPRPKGGAPMWRSDLAPFTSWLANASALLKSLAPSTLVASGAEGDTQRLSLGQAALLSQNGSGIDVVTIHAWPMNFQWLDPSSAASATYALAAARTYLGASVAEAAALGKPALVEEFGWPRDMGSLSPAAPTAARDAMYTMVFDAVTASAESAGALAGAAFWGYAGSGRPEFGAAAVPVTAAEACAGAAARVPPPMMPAAAAATPPLRNFAGGAADWSACFFDEGARPEACPYWTWWAPAAAWPNATFRGQSTLVHDPPHESQGWYSVYDADASTLAVVAKAARRLAQLQACARAAVASTRAAERMDGVAVGGLYGAAACVSALGAPPDAGGDSPPPRVRACAAAAMSAAAAAGKPALPSTEQQLLSRTSSGSANDASFWARLGAAAPAPGASYDAGEEEGRRRLRE